MPSFEATYPTNRAAAKEVRHRVRVFLEEQDLSDSDVRDAVIAIGEACSNAILYAATDGGFRVFCGYEDPLITMRVRDFGRGFSLQGKGQYIEPEFRTRGGLGIYLMRVLMTEVTYEMNDTGTTVSLVLQTHTPNTTEE